MKRLHVFTALLWLGTAFGSASAAPPSYQELQAHPGRALPMQPTWQLQPALTHQPPWKEIFTFTEPMARSRWLSLNPGKSSDYAPALLDTTEGRPLFLSPEARSFCNGRWQVVWVDAIGMNTAMQPTFKVWLVENKPEGGQRAVMTHGRIDAQGSWTVPPVDCNGANTAAIESSNSLTYRTPDEASAAATDLQVDTVYAQPGLRDKQRQWRTPAPPRDITTAQWMDYQQQSIKPDATGAGLINARGQMVIPFIFGDLPDATAQRRIRLCTAVGLERQRNANTPQACDWQRLHGNLSEAGLQPVKDADTGRWGYQNAQGQWVIAPQFQAARPFRHGYAVVTGAFPEQWRPPGWQDEQPIFRKFQRMGRYWMASAVVRNESTNESTNGQREIRYGLLNATGQWLVPVPQPTLHITVPSSPNGLSSHYAQLLARHLPQWLGRSVQVNHLPNASDADYQRLAAQGGNTQVLLAAVMLPRGGIQGLHQGPPIDAALQSLRPVTLVASQPLVLVMDSAKANSLGIHNIDELLTHARAHPGSLRIGTGDDGWMGHLAFNQFRALSGADVQRVVFKGMYPRSDTITQAHAVDLLFAPVNSVAVAVERGQLLVLGTTADPAHPQSLNGQPWPTLASSPALRGFTIYDHFSLWAAANSDAAANRTLQQAVAQVLAQPEVQKHLQEIQVVGGGGSPESLLEREEQERQSWLHALSLPKP